MEATTLVLASIAADAVRWLVFIVAAPLILLGWYTFLRKMGSF